MLKDNIDQFYSFREIMNRALEFRARRNPKYSLRAFARDLKMSPSRLSEILNSGATPSTSTARNIARGLKFRGKKIDAFCDLVRFESSGLDKPSLAKLSKQVLDDFQLHSINEDQFAMINDWYHLAILELIADTSRPWTPSSIATYLNLDRQLVVIALERLRRLKIVSLTNDQYEVSKLGYEVQTNVPSSAIEAFHRQLLLKALEGLSVSDRNRRDYNSVVHMIPLSKIGWFKERITDFLDEIGHELRNDIGDDPGELHCLQVHLFPLHPVDQAMH
jgi:uncharacterized protein (TIGR02147 family)